MTESISTRLLNALRRPEIPLHVQREVHNAVCGITASDPPAVKWKQIYAALMHHLKVLRSNKQKVRPDLREAWQEYYDTVSALPAQIREADQSQLPPYKHWQGFVPKEVRDSICLQFELARQRNPMQGSIFLPFAPIALRQANKQRIASMETAIAMTRSTWNTRGTPSHPASHLPVGAVMLAACRQAERTLADYKKRNPHPYEEPAKVKWQDYCEPETRAKVRRLLVDPADVYFDLAPYEPFLKP